MYSLERQESGEDIKQMAASWESNWRLLQEDCRLATTTAETAEQLFLFHSLVFLFLFLLLCPRFGLCGSEGSVRCGGKLHLPGMRSSVISG